MAPLGYDTKDRKITVNTAEAEAVRQIFRSYLRFGSLNLLMENLRKTGIVSKIRKRKDGQIIGGTALTRGGLAYLLRNRFYVGEVTFKGEVLPGEQPAIIDRKLFDAVQAKLDQQLNSHKTTRQTSEALLSRRIYDDRGNLMGPSHTRKKGLKYRYYLSNVLVQGQRKKAGKVCRVPATEIEALVAKSLRDYLKLTEPIDDRALIETHLVRVVVEPERLCLTLSAKQTSDGAATKKLQVLYVPWRKPPSKRKREILRSSAPENQRTWPIRSETRAVLIASIARGRRWLNDIFMDAKVTTAHIATREKCSVRKVNMTMSLAFLAPTLVKAAVDGRLPDGLGVARLSDMPAEWSRQYQALGLASP